VDSSPPRGRLWALFALGGLALASLLWMPFEDLLPTEALVPGIRWIALIQPAVLLTVAILAGHRLAPAVGLGTPMLDAMLSGRRRVPSARSRVRAAALASLAVALLVSAILWRYATMLPGLFEGQESSRLAEFRAPVAVRLLWGGIGEELLMRWGLLTAFAWAGWRLAGQPARVPRAIMWLAIALAALLFAVGHLPLLFLLLPAPPASMLLAVFAGNFVPALLFGWLFWRHGLESAMLAHGGAHFFAWSVGA
jgi:membrane protease YdiL (CAAX protease family)